ncbi:DNA-binding protein [uncultured Methylobacterium sp.]|uniref:DNA-binding protein n=1 Tax=uncultured Methylobacterium sp. TaxID=157278 RepID=UPI0035CABA4E
MLRSRVRRSFTVEIKSKTRHVPSWPETQAPSPVNWAALDPSPEPPETPPAEAAAGLREIEKPRRILPSLLAAEPAPEVPEPAAEREPPLPRVRRVKPRRPLSEPAPSVPSWSLADFDDAAPAPEPAIAPPASVAQSAPPARKVPLRRTSAVLRPGERWKRRLPRSCW